MIDNEYELIFNTPREIFQPFFIELAIKGGYDELLYIYDKKKAEVESYLSKTGREILAKKGFKIFCHKDKVEKIIKKEKLFSEQFDDFLKTIKFEKINSYSNEWLKQKLTIYYNLFVKYSRIYRFTESFYSPLVDETIRNFVSENTGNKNLISYSLSLLLNPSKKDYIIKKRERLLSSLKANEQIICLCESVRKIGKAKLTMRSNLDRYWDLLGNSLDIIAEKLCLSPTQTKSLFYNELLMMLHSSKMIDEKTLENANRRSKFFIAKKVGGKYRYYSGQNAKKVADSVRQIIPKNITEILGDIVSVGHAKGKVIILPYGISRKEKVELRQKIAKMKNGEIIVTANAGPEMIIACHKAAAIITDEGGINSHAATISRELEIPGIVNTKIATKTLNDGDLVEIEATNKGIIKILRKYGN